jgi:hypothetical protein
VTCSSLSPRVISYGSIAAVVLLVTDCLRFPLSETTGRHLISPTNNQTDPSNNKQRHRHRHRLRHCKQETQWLKKSWRASRMVVVAGRSDDRQLHLFTNRGFGIALFENMNESLTFGMRKNYGKIQTAQTSMRHASCRGRS